MAWNLILFVYSTSLIWNINCFFDYNFFRFTRKNNVSFQLVYNRILLTNVERSTIKSSWDILLQIFHAYLFFIILFWNSINKECNRTYRIVLPDLNFKHLTFLCKYKELFTSLNVWNRKLGNNYWVVFQKFITIYFFITI